MLHGFIVLVVCIWLAISGAIYAGLWHAWLGRVTLPGRYVLNLLASALLSPGVVTGHGIAPYPGGLASLATATGHDNTVRIFNFSMWVLSFILLLLLDRLLQRRAVRSQEARR